MAQFNCSILPNDLRHLVLGWLHDEEAHKVMRANRSIRQSLLYRGLFPRFIEEINVWCDGKENEDEYVKITVLYRKESFEKPSDITHCSHTDSLSNLALLKTLNKLRFVKKLFLTLHTFDKKHFETQKGLFEGLLSKLQACYLFHHSSLLNIAQIFFCTFNPESIVESSLHIYPNMQSETADINDLHHRLLSKPVYRNTPFLNIGELDIDQLPFYGMLNVGHLEINLRKFDLFLDVVEKVMRNGIPSQHSQASCQIRDQLCFRLNTTPMIVFKALIEKLEQSSTLEAIERSALRSDECLEFERLHYFGSMEYYENKFQTRKVAERETKVADKEPKENLSAFLLQKHDHEKILIFVSVVQLERIKYNVRHDTCVIWMRRSEQ